MIIYRKQEWKGYTRLLFIGEHCTVQAELFKKEQEFGSKALIYALYTEKGQRRKGYATEALDEAERVIKEMGYTRASLEWRGEDTPKSILAWYVRRGYRCLSEIPGKYALLRKHL